MIITFNVYKFTANPFRMRAVIQRVTSASVMVEGAVKGVISSGLLVLVGIESSDTRDDVFWLADKVRQMRIFSDEMQKMNLSVEDVNGQILVISQFTLHASTKKGNRPSFIKAARPEQAIPLYELLLQYLEERTGRKIESGSFGADMEVGLVNSGPVTIIIDSKNRE